MCQSLRKFDGGDTRSKSGKLLHMRFRDISLCALDLSQDEQGGEPCGSFAKSMQCISRDLQIQFCFTAVWRIVESSCTETTFARWANYRARKTNVVETREQLESCAGDRWLRSPYDTIRHKTVQ